MEFLHTDSDDPNSPIDSLRVNWYYRPRDVQRFNSDSRLVYATMHSDMCPLTSLRGLCTIKHRSEIDDLEAYRRERDTFYFVQVFDRFIRRFETNYMRAAIYGIMSVIQWLSLIRYATSLIAAAVVLLLAAAFYALAGLKKQEFAASKTLGGQGVAQMIV